MGAQVAIKAALQQLGYDSPDVEIEQADAPHLHKVWLDGSYFGVWDNLKGTFVD